jgi:hypothetical protein
MSGFDNEVLYAIGERLEPSTAQAIGLMQKTVNDVSIINNAGTPEGVVSANPASLTHDRSNGQLYLKRTGTGNTGWLPIGTSADDLHTAKFIVNAAGTVGTGANYSTIASAIAAAASGDTIFIMPGTYTENLTGKAGVNLTAFTCDALTPNVTIAGTFTFTVSGTASISGINLQTNSAELLAVTGSAASIVNLKDCNLNMTNSTGITFSSSNASAKINIYNCTGNLGTTGIGYWAHSSAGTLSLYYSNLTNTGLSTTTSTISSGNTDFYYCGFAAPITTSGTASFTSRSTRYTTSATNSTCFTIGASSTQFSEFDRFFSGTASAISVSTILTLSHAIISSSNANTLTGSGTLNYAFTSFIGSSAGFNVTTMTALSTLI